MFERTSKKLGLDQAVLDNINITDIANSKSKKENLAQVKSLAQNDRSVLLSASKLPASNRWEKKSMIY